MINTCRKAAQCHAQICNIQLQPRHQPNTSHVYNQARLHFYFQRGASLVEFVVVAPTLLFTILGIVQSGMVFHAKSNLNYAAFEAARAGSVAHADTNSIRQAFTRGMTGYYGGGRNIKELGESTARAEKDINPSSMQVEILSPTKESFDDYASPKLKAQYGVSTRVIPNNNLSAISCPIDNTSCNSNPASNASGQTLSDANLLRVKITYGIPASKQIPLAGPFYVKVLQGLTDLGIAAETDPFKLALLKQGRIPMVATTTIRMQSDPIEDGNVGNPGSGNNGDPTDSGTGEPADNGSGAGTSDGDQGNDGDVDNPPCDPAVDIECAPNPNPCDADVVSEDLPSDVLFDFDFATLKAGGKAELDKLINKLNAEKANPARTNQIFITGYADKIGDDTYNLNLSRQRADAVKEYIQQNLDDDVGLDIKAEGKGELEPKTSPGVCTDANTASNKANCAPDRRVNITRTYAVAEADAAN